MSVIIVIYAAPLTPLAPPPQLIGIYGSPMGRVSVCVHGLGRRNLRVGHSPRAAPLEVSQHVLTGLWR